MDLATIQNLQPVNQYISVAQHGSDRGLFVEFYDEMVLQAFKSEAAGHPIYLAVPHIIIRYAGGKADLKRKIKMVDDEHSPSDLNRFPRQWAAFKANQEQAQSGTPLELMPWLKKEQIFGLKAQQVMTVEQLANLPDSSMSIMGMREMRDRAQKYIAASTGDHAAVSELTAKTVAQATDIEMLKAQIAELSQMLTAKRGSRQKETSNAEG